MNNHHHPKNITAEEIRNQESAVKKSVMKIKERNPVNNKILSFKSVVVYGECCWIFWKKKNGGPNFTALSPKNYDSDWSIKKVGVNNCDADPRIILKEETHCIAIGCGKRNNVNPGAYIYDNDIKSSSEPPNKSIYPTKDTEGTYTTINSQSVTENFARINKLETESIISNLSLVSHSTNKDTTIYETMANSSKHLETQSDCTKSKSNPYIHIITFIWVFSLMLRN